MDMEVKVLQPKDEKGQYRIVFGRLEQDPDVGNPLTEMDGFGRIYSLGSRHVNHDPERVQDALENNKDAVPLSYFEHGQCIWFVQGSRPGMPDMRWDGVELAGVWVPDMPALEEGLKGKKRRARMLELAEQACKVYTSWCNGETYYYKVEVFALKLAEDGTPILDRDEYEISPVLDSDSCGGYYGDEDAKAALAEAMKEVSDRLPVAA